MENALSNSPPVDNLADGRTDSGLSATVASSSQSLSSLSRQAIQPTASSALQNNKTVDANESISVVSSETNNNIKLFKNEYDLTKSGVQITKSMKQNNGISEQHQLSAFKSNMLPMATDNQAITSDLAGSKTNLTDYSPTSHRMETITTTATARESDERSPQATRSAAADSNDVDATDQYTAESNQHQQQHDQTQQEKHEQLEQQEQQVPSKVQPANNRSILILREIEPDSPESSVREIFNSENCASKPVHCEYALHNSWYVTFKDDEDARLALAFIRKHSISWQGRPIMARYKPKPAVPSATNEPPIHHHHHHHHNLNHLHDQHQQSHQIVPNMVMQQQQQSHYNQNGVIENTATVFLSMPPPPPPQAPASSVDGDSTTTSGHPHQQVHQHPLAMSPNGVMSHQSTSGPSTARSTNGNGSSDVPTGPPPYFHPSALPLPAHFHHPHSHTHHHQPDGTMLQHTHPMAHMMGSPTQHHPHFPMAPVTAGYGTPYYNQHGQLVHAPWDLSSVFIYNGLSPYNKTSVSAVAFVGGAYHHQANQPQPHTNNHHQHHHYPPHQRHHQNNNHRHQQQQQGQSHHNNHNSHHQAGANSSGHNSQQQTFNNNNHQSAKPSRKNNKQNNK